MFEHLEISNFSKNQKRNSSYDTVPKDINDNIKYSSEIDNNKLSFLNELINTSSGRIEEMIDDREKYNLSDDEVLVGKALISLMRNWVEFIYFCH